MSGILARNQGVYNNAARYKVTNITQEVFTSYWGKNPITLKPGQTVSVPQYLANKMECLAPQETITDDGLYSSPLSAFNFLAMASLSSRIPEVGVYLVKPDWIAAIAAFLMGSGVSKSGSPTPKAITSFPSLIMRLALAVIWSVAEGLTSLARRDRFMP